MRIKAEVGKIIGRVGELISGSHLRSLNKELDDTWKIYNKLDDLAKPKFVRGGDMTEYINARMKYLEDIKNPNNVLYGLNKKIDSIADKRVTEAGKVLLTDSAVLGGAGYGAYKMNKKAEIVFEKIAKKKKKNNLLSELAAGGAAGAAGTTLTHSLENVQIKQTGTPGKIWSDTASKMKQMYREGVGSSPGYLRKMVGKKLPEVEKVMGGLGTKGVYRGLPIKLLKVVPTMAISLPVYTYLSKKFK